MITKLLKLLHLRLDLNTPEEIVEGLKLIALTEQLDSEAVANLNLLWTKGPQAAGSFSSKVTIDKLHAEGLVTTYVTAVDSSMKALTCKGMRVLQVAEGLKELTKPATLALTDDQRAAIRNSSLAIPPTSFGLSSGIKAASSIVESWKARAAPNPEIEPDDRSFHLYQQVQDFCKENPVMIITPDSSPIDYPNSASVINGELRGAIAHFNDRCQNYWFDLTSIKRDA